MEQRAKRLQSSLDTLDFDGKLLVSTHSKESIPLTRLDEILVLGKGSMQLSGFATYGQEISPPLLVQALLK